MDINVNLKITLEETPALLNCLAAFSESLQRVNAIINEPAPVAQPVAPAPVPVQAPAVQTAPAAPVQTAVPAAPARVYTLPELQAACAPLMDQGKLNELQQVVASFGVSSLLDIPAARYGELATKLRELGARL
jgi:hypothetical protein|nr:MAG TPA_asm: hypothetical protein [Caudoviricetes sp.]